MTFAPCFRVTSFFNAVVQGLDLGQAFELAQQAMSAYQTAQMQGIGANAFLGATFAAGKDIPTIGTVSADQLLDEGTAATLWAGDIDSFYPLERVWCSIIPPSHAPNTNGGVPVIDIPELEMQRNPTSGRYEATFEGFSEEGVYRIHYYAQDIWNSISIPRQSSVIQSGFDDRIILLVGGATNDANWSAFNHMGTLAYNTFQSRLFDHEHMYYLNAHTNQDLDRFPDGTNDVDALPTLDNLHTAFTNWAATADRLTVYLIGMGVTNQLQLNSTEVLAATELDAWLDAFQGTNRAVHVIMDFSGAGAYIPLMQPPPDRERITLASSRSNRDSLSDVEGIISFS